MWQHVSKNTGATPPLPPFPKNFRKSHHNFYGWSSQMEVWMIMMIINYKIYLMFCRSDWGLFLFSIAHLLDKRQTIYSLGSSQSYLSWPPFIIFIIFERIVSLNRQFALVRFGGVWEGFSYKYIKMIPNISPLQSRAKIYIKKYI